MGGLERRPNKGAETMPSVSIRVDTEMISLVKIVIKLGSDNWTGLKIESPV